jgi:oxygen-independent coproporphyrinogen-3 oxidase
MIDVNLDLIKKYDKPGPRYTSYPTAPQFNEKCNREAYKNEFLNNKDSSVTPPDVSLYFHIPYCDTQCYFCGCNMLLTRDSKRIENYLTYLIKEMDLTAPLFSEKQRVKQLHWGGGTPSYLSPEQILKLTGAIKSRFNIAEDLEASCEIDPRGLTTEHLEALREGGFSRISMGIQDFNIKTQKAVNRVQSEELTRRVTGKVRELGFSGLNVDLMYGLPYQSAESFSDTLDKIIDISADRIAVFNFAHLPQLKKHMRMIDAATLPHPDEKLKIFKLTIEKLTSSGYVFIGMDHFAKADDELTIALKNKQLHRNFQGYSTQAGLNLHAFGITGISETSNLYMQNFKTEKEYYTVLDEGLLPAFKGVILSDDDKLRREIVMRLMCDFEIDKKRISSVYNIDFNSYFADVLKDLKPMESDGLLTLNEDKIEVTGAGRLLIRNIAMCFDSYLKMKKDNTVYSRTV